MTVLPRLHTAEWVIALISSRMWASGSAFLRYGRFMVMVAKAAEPLSRMRSNSTAVSFRPFGACVAGELPPAGGRRHGGCADPDRGR